MEPHAPGPDVSPISSNFGVSPKRLLKPSTWKVGVGAREIKADLKVQIVGALALGVSRWVGTILVANFALVTAAYYLRANEARAPYHGAFDFTMSLVLWSAGIWLFAVVGYLFKRATNEAIHKEEHPSLVLFQMGWFGYALALSLWWTFGMFALQNPPPTNPPSFVLGQRTFIWMTALGHVATVVLLSTDWWLLAVTLLGGFFVPVVVSLTRSHDPSATVSVFWLSGQMSTYLLVGLVLKIDQTKLLARQIIVERATRSLMKSNILLEERQRRISVLLSQGETDQRKLQKRQHALKAERIRANELLRQNEVDQKKLLAKQLMLEEERTRANDLLYQRNHLLASFSHDLRSPLTALATGLDNLTDKIARGISRSDLEQSVKKAEAQVSVMADMVNTALDLARVEAGQYPIRRQEIDVKSLLEHVASEIHAEAERKGIKVVVLSPPYIGFSDRDALLRIICNLAANAVKYTECQDGREGRILIACQRRGEYLRISVFDNGIGIAVDDQKAIFREYVQLGNPERDGRKGIGLGLSIVAALAKLLNHFVDLASVPGKGSRFSVAIPLSGRMPINHECPSNLKLMSPDLDGMVVAVLEDNRDVREAMTERLQSWGCEVVACGSKESLMASLVGRTQSELPNLLLADYRLRGGNTGLEAIRKLKKLFPNVPAVILSGEVKSTVLAEVADAGFMFLSKPVSRNELIELLVRFRPIHNDELPVR